MPRKYSQIAMEVQFSIGFSTSLESYKFRFTISDYLTICKKYRLFQHPESLNCWSSITMEYPPYPKVRFICSNKHEWFNQKIFMYILPNVNLA